MLVTQIELIYLFQVSDERTVVLGRHQGKNMFKIRGMGGAKSYILPKVSGFWASHGILHSENKGFRTGTEIAWKSVRESVFGTINGSGTPPPK